MANEPRDRYLSAEADEQIAPSLPGTLGFQLTPERGWVTADLVQTDGFTSRLVVSSALRMSTDVARRLRDTLNSLDALGPVTPDEARVVARKRVGGEWEPVEADIAGQDPELGPEQVVERMIYELVGSLTHTDPVLARTSGLYAGRVGTLLSALSAVPQERRVFVDADEWQVLVSDGTRIWRLDLLGTERMPTFDEPLDAREESIARALLAYTLGRMEGLE